MTKTKIAIIGCGSVGVAIGLAIKQAMKDIEIVVHDKERDAARRMIAQKAADREEWNLPRASEGAALVLLAIPQDGMALTLRAIGADLPEGAIVCAIGGSNKTNLDLGRQHLGQGVAMVGSRLVIHPDNAQHSATPDAKTLSQAVWTIAAQGSEEQVNAFAGFVRTLGAQPVFVDALENDGMALSVDALPRLLGSMLMLTVSGDDAWRERTWAAGAEFSSATAGAENSAALSAAVLANKAAAVHWLNQLMLQCMALRDDITDGDEAGVLKQLQTAQDRRTKWLADWRAGRDVGATPITASGRSLMGLFVGQRVADRMSGKKPE